MLKSENWKKFMTEKEYKLFEKNNSDFFNVDIGKIEK